MADVQIDGDFLDIKLSLADKLLSFHGSFHIPLSHVTNAYVSDQEDLQLLYKLIGTNFCLIKSAAVFANPSGLIFCDVSEGDCLVVETRGERFPRIAVQLPDDRCNFFVFPAMRSDVRAKEGTDAGGYRHRERTPKRHAGRGRQHICAARFCANSSEHGEKEERRSRDGDDGTRNRSHEGNAEWQRRTNREGCSG
jgi:hypothetical protein